MRHGEQYAAGKLAWLDFVQKSKADMREVTLNGSMLKGIKQQLDQGQVERAAEVLGQSFSEDMNFLYQRHNRPQVLQGTVGRLLGQYGTWPTWFASNIEMMATRGSRRNRIETFGRFMAINSAVYFGAREMFGADLARWTFFAPLPYTGGPFAQIGGQAISAASAKMTGTFDTDPIAQINAARLKRAPLAVTPLPIGMLLKAVDASELIANEDYKRATLRLLGIPESK
jgi:hypothetical protein